MDWYGNPAAADTEQEDELRYRRMRNLLAMPVDVTDA